MVGPRVVLQGQEHVLVRPCSTSAIVCPLPVLTQLAWYAERIWSGAVPAHEGRERGDAELLRQAGGHLLPVVVRARHLRPGRRGAAASGGMGRPGRQSREDRRGVVQPGHRQHVPGQRGGQRHRAVVGVQPHGTRVRSRGPGVRLQPDPERGIDLRDRRGGPHVGTPRVGRDAGEPRRAQPRFGLPHGSPRWRRTGRCRRPGSGSGGTARCPACSPWPRSAAPPPRPASATAGPSAAASQVPPRWAGHGW